MTKSRHPALVNVSPLHSLEAEPTINDKENKNTYHYFLWRCFASIAQPWFTFGGHFLNTVACLMDTQGAVKRVAIHKHIVGFSGSSKAHTAHFGVIVLLLGKVEIKIQ